MLLSKQLVCGSTKEKEVIEASISAGLRVMKNRDKRRLDKTICTSTRHYQQY